MLVVALVFVPVVILYQTWVYRLFATRMQSQAAPSGEAY